MGITSNRRADEDFSSVPFPTPSTVGSLQVFCRGHRLIRCGVAQNTPQTLQQYWRLRYLCPKGSQGRNQLCFSEILQEIKELSSPGALQVQVQKALHWCLWDWRVLQGKGGGTDLSLLWDDSQFLQEEGLCLLSSAASPVSSRDLGTWSWRYK